MVYEVVKRKRAKKRVRESGEVKRSDKEQSRKGRVKVES
jgi:hypothetical protein